MIGPTFAAVLAAAAGGDEDAFGMLWYDLQPRLLRYFNVIGPRQSPSGPYAAVVPRWPTSMSMAGRT